MRVTDAKAEYDQADERQFRAAVREADADNLKRQQSIEYFTVLNHDTGETVALKWTNAGWVEV